MDAKKLAMVIGIAVLLPLFVGLFVDAIYESPNYEDYCNFRPELTRPLELPPNNCSFDSTPEYEECINNEGMPRFDFDENNCQIYSECDYCNKDYEQINEVYNRNIFFILAPIGLAIVILGLYLTVDYLGAGLMFAGLITLFYATARAFPDLGKLSRAIIILIELLIIMWIGYKKIDKK